ncbi:N-acyl amino acid synthase FeeM domain-containing protein [Roseiconus lacunae]|uniref:N-acyl amino acid synthase FeeM domain-containing protein n=1 Tax=Roseiconus lacunae TaxID=2605694 RepID=UPI0011F21485|nr:hypothetical protein [Roseiconus lacunae]
MQSIESLRSVRLRDPARQVLSSKVKIQQSVQCRRAITAEDFKRAEEFRQHRYQEAGLLGESDTSSIQTARNRSPVVFEEDQHWQALTFLAFRTTEYWFESRRGPRFSSEPRFRGDPTRDSREVICGTVTMLVSRSDHLSESSDHVGVGRVCRLAIEHDRGDSKTPTSYRGVFLSLTGLMHQTAIELGLSYMDAIVHPRHAKLYRRIFNAEPIGKPFICQEVSGAPGQYMRANIAKPSRFHQRLRDGYDKGQLKQTAIAS